MSVYDHDVITRARIVRERLALLRLHQTEEQRQLHALALHELLEAGGLLGLPRTFVHRATSGPPEPSEERPEFGGIDAAVEQYILG